MHGTCGLNNPWHRTCARCPNWVGNPRRPPYVILRGSAWWKNYLKQKNILPHSGFYDNKNVWNFRFHICVEINEIYHLNCPFRSNGFVSDMVIFLSKFGKKVWFCNIFWPILTTYATNIEKQRVLFLDLVAYHGTMDRRNVNTNKYLFHLKAVPWSHALSHRRV